MVGFTLDLFPDSLHDEMNEGEEVGRHTCAIVVLVCGAVTPSCMWEQEEEKHRGRRYEPQHLLYPYCLIWLPVCPPISLTLLGCFDLEPLLSWLRELLFVGLEVLFAHCYLFPVWSLPPSGLWASDPGASCRAYIAHVVITRKLLLFHLGLWVWIGSTTPEALMDGLIDNQVDPCSAGWHTPYFTGRHLMRIKEVVRSSEQPIKTIKREEWKMSF